MSGISLSAKEPAIADRLLVADELTVYHGQPTQLSRFVRVIINGVIGRIYFEELTPAEDQAYMVRHYDFVAQKQAADAAMTKAEDAKRKAKAAAEVAQQMTQHNMAILAQLSQEADRRTALLQEKTALQDKHNAAVVEHAETVAKMHGAKQAAMEAAQATIDGLQAQCASLCEVNAQQQQQLNALAEQFGQAQQSIANLQQTCQSLKDSTDAAIADNRSLQVQLQNAASVKAADDALIASLRQPISVEQIKHDE